MSSARRSPRPLAEALRAARRRAEPPTLLGAAQGAWREAAGERIAAQATPVSERDGVLTVACRAATWAEELDLLHDELLAALNRSLGRERVRRLRFVAAGDQ